MKQLTKSFYIEHSLLFKVKTVKLWSCKLPYKLLTSKTHLLSMCGFLSVDFSVGITYSFKCHDGLSRLHS